MTAETKLTRARIALLLDEPFWGTLVCNLALRRCDEVVTMATDGREVLWSATAVNKWSEAAVKTVLAHEAMHCALLHQVRRGGRDPRLWNIACDYAVNLVLDDCIKEARAAGRKPPFEWPQWPERLLDEQYRGMSAEAIYEKLKQQQPQGGSGSESGDNAARPSMGAVNDAPGANASEAERANEEAHWKQLMVQAVNVARERGSVPARIKCMVDELLNPKVDWRTVLRRFVSDRARDDYSWSRPNARYAASGFMLPSLYSQRLGVIGVIRDTSGSTMDWQEEVLAELAGIISETRPAKVVCMDADAGVQRTLELEPGDTLPTDAVGGGGTDFRPAIEAMESYAPVACVYITDLQGEMPEAAPSYPLIWVTNGSEEAPFGETVGLDKQLKTS